MLVVKVELWPGGIELRAKEIGTLEICNISGLAETSDYFASMTEADRATGKMSITGQGKVMGFNRETGKPFDLIALAIAACRKGLQAEAREP